MNRTDRWPISNAMRMLGTLLPRDAVRYLPVHLYTQTDVHRILQALPVQSSSSVNKRPPLQSRQPLPTHRPLYIRSERCTPRSQFTANPSPSPQLIEKRGFNKLQAVCTVMHRHDACHPRHAREPNTFRQPSLLHTDQDGCRLSQL